MKNLLLTFSMLATLVFALPAFSQNASEHEPTLIQTLLEGDANLTLVSEGCGPWQRNGRCWLVRQCCVSHGVCAPWPCSTTRCTEQFQNVCN